MKKNIDKKAVPIDDSIRNAERKTNISKALRVYGITNDEQCWQPLSTMTEACATRIVLSWLVNNMMCKSEEETY